MAIEVELPDGSIAEFPDGTSPEVMKSALAKRFGRAKPKTLEELTPGLSTNPTDGMGIGSRLASASGSRMNDLGTALKQTGIDLAQYVSEGGMYGAAARQFAPDQPSRSPLDLGGRASDALIPAETALRAEQTERNALDAPLMDTKAGKVGYGATMFAELLTPAGLLRGTTAGRALLPRTLGGNATQGAALGAATNPLDDDDSRALNVAAGGAAGVLGHGVARGLEKWGSKAANAVGNEVRQVYEAAKARGIDLTPEQLTDSRFLKWAQSMLRSVPFTGAQGRYAEQVGALNKAVAGTIGEDAPVVTSNVYSAAKARQSRQFNDLTARNNLRVDQPLMQNLTRLVDESDMAGAEVRGQVEAAVDRLARQAVAGPNGVVIPGRAYQNFDSEIGKVLKGGGTPAFYLGQVRDTVREAMDRSISPADSAAWSALRREYGNRKTLTPLVANASDGPLSPASLQRAVTNNGASKEAMASGTRGELGTLAKIGQRMKEPPSSGSAERMMFGGAFNPVNWPGLAAGVTVGAPASRLLDSKALAKLMMRENPGMRRKSAAKTAGALVKLLGLQALPVAAGED
jgi:hypothetical protein